MLYGSQQHDRAPLWHDCVACLVRRKSDWNWVEYLIAV